MLDISIEDWNDITAYLNGYVLSKVEISGERILGYNSRGDRFLLATRTGVYWEASSGNAYIAMSEMLREINQTILKPNQIYDLHQKDQVVVSELEKIIRLKNKDYKF